MEGLVLKMGEKNIFTIQMEKKWREKGKTKEKKKHCQW